MTWDEFSKEYETKMGKKLEERYELAKEQGALWDEDFTEYALDLMEEAYAYDEEYGSSPLAYNLELYVLKEYSYQYKIYKASFIYPYAEDYKKGIGFILTNGVWEAREDGKKINTETHEYGKYIDALLSTLSILQKEYEDLLFLKLVKHEMRNNNAKKAEFYTKTAEFYGVNLVEQK